MSKYVTSTNKSNSQNRIYHSTDNPDECPSLQSDSRLRPVGTNEVENKDLGPCERCHDVESNNPDEYEKKRCPACGGRFKVLPAHLPDCEAEL